MIAFLINMYIVKKYVRLKISKKDYIIKPIIATFMMGVCLLFTYNSLIGIISEKLCTIIALIVSVVVYIIFVFILKIFSEDNIYMIPYGKNIYQLLKSIGIYGKEEKWQ